MVRSCLSHYCPEIAPAAWRFVENEHGRPDVAPSVGAPPIVFNLSHTEGLAACAVVLDAPVGVDVEWVDRRSATTEIADRFFAAAEVEQLHATPPAAQKSRFFDFWTLKESYIKARGKGLALPLAQFAFSVVEGPPIRLSVAPQLGDDPARWEFALWSPLPTHRAALTVGRARMGRRPTHAWLFTRPGTLQRWQAPTHA
jgi:4'-phosphopantetheinyl transferase